MAQGFAFEIIGGLMISALLLARNRSWANGFLALGILCALYRQNVIKMEIWGNIDHYPWLFRSTFPVELLAIPSMYIYVLALTTPNFKLQRSHLLHLLPMAFGLCWYLGFLLWGSEDFFLLGLALSKEAYLRLIIKILIVFPYLFFVRKKVMEFSLKLKGLFSDTTYLRLYWLKVILSIFYIFFAVDTLDLLAGPMIPVRHISPVIAFGALLVLVFFSLRYSAVFAKEINSQEAEEKNTAVSFLSQEQLSSQKKKLLNLLEEENYYLNPELRLSDLANAMGVKPYRLSEVINRGFQSNFYDLINGYRVKKAEEILLNPDSSHLNLLGVAMESGFKSKSVFNEVFKRTTGKTPSQYRVETDTEKRLN